MVLVKVVCFLLFANLALGNSIRDEPPKFPKNYQVEGVLSLPYAEIDETFVGYYDEQNQRSRVDYYGDMVLTVQRPDLNKYYKLVYAVDTSGDPERICFEAKGSEELPANIQSVIPDLTGFTYKGLTDCNISDFYINMNVDCEIWENVVDNGDKQNKYIMYVARDDEDKPVPVYYIMNGYNTLFGSHYDEYRVKYRNYKIVNFEDETFNIGLNYTCRGFPGPGHQHVVNVNPIAEFFNNKREHVDSAFEDFKNFHGKEYEDDKHHHDRKTIFHHNYRFINSKNRQNLHFKLAVNKFADMTQDEMRSYRGKLYTKGYNGGQPFRVTKSNKKVPDYWDWRLNGAVTPVKDQAVCGSCWSFGTTGTIEGVNFVKTGHLVRLSQQQLIDCSWNEGDNGCDGGEDFRAYNYIMKAGGITTEDIYGRYLGNDGKCHDKDVQKVVKISGFVNVTTNNVDALKIALFENGPVTVAIDAGHKSLSFYSHGVYSDPECKNKPEDLNHQVLAVGYGTLNGQDYWLIKNSWSTYWGNDGYVLIAQKDNTCGVMTSPTYPIIA